MVNRNEVGDALCNNIRNIMTSYGPMHLSIIEELIKHSISSKGNSALVDIPLKEIKVAIFQIGPIKAPSLDGFLAKFY